MLTSFSRDSHHTVSLFIPLGVPLSDRLIVSYLVSQSVQIAKTTIQLDNYKFLYCYEEVDLDNEFIMELILQILWFFRVSNKP